MKRITKMELVNAKKKEIVLSRSVKLLKDKRDSLLSKIAGSISETIKAYNNFSQEEDKLISVFKVIYIKYPSLFLNLESLNHEHYFNIKFKPFHFLNLSWFLLSPDFDLSYFDEEFFILEKEDITLLKEAMEEFVRVLCSFSSLASNISVFLSEIRKLTRRVNYIDKTKLPQVKKKISLLETSLDEFEREEILRLKKVKEKIEKKNYIIKKKIIQ